MKHIHPHVNLKMFTTYSEQVFSRAPLDTCLSMVASKFKEKYHNDSIEHPPLE